MYKTTMLRSIKNKAELQYCSLLCLKLVAINAVLAIIADGGGAIVVIYTKGRRNNVFSPLFIDCDKTLRRRPHPAPCEEAPGVGVCSSIKTMALEGETAPSWWGCLCACV
jgi:hypothetical protein